MEKFANIKKYGNSYKLTVFKTIPAHGNGGIRGINDRKLSCSISRSRARIFELAMCNPWDFFITVTLNKDKYERTNLKKFQKDFSQFIRNQSKKYDTKIKYLLIPELHADGVSWHMHGLIKGITERMISEFDPDKHPLKLIKGGYKNWTDYEQKFGFVSLGRIRNHEAVAKYTTKYITKEVAKNVTDVGARMFYSSQGLAGAEVIKKGTLATYPTHKWDFENEYVSILWISEEEVNMYVKEGKKYDRDNRTAAMY